MIQKLTIHGVPNFCGTRAISANAHLWQLHQPSFFATEFVRVCSIAIDESMTKKSAISYRMEIKRGVAIVNSLLTVSKSLLINTAIAVAEIAM